MIFQESVGIDIRSGTLCLTFLKGSLKGIEVAGHGTFTIDAAQINTDTIKEIAGIYDQFRAEHGIGDPDIYVGLPRELFFIRSLTFPPAVKENIASTLRYEMEKFVPIPVDDIYFDFLVHGESGSSNGIQVLLVVVKKSDMAPFLDLCHFIKPGITAFEPGAIATVNGLSHLSSTSDPINGILARVDHDRIETDLVKNGIICGWRINEFQEGDVTESAAAIKAELGAWAEGAESEANASSLQASLWGAGVSDELIRQLSDAPGFGVARLEYDPSKLSELSLSTAYGLAVKGHKKVPMQVNLLPETLRRRKSRMGLYTMFVLVALVLISLGAWGLSRALHQRMVLDRMGTEVAHLKTEVKHVRKIEAELIETEQQIQYLNSLTAGYMPVSELLRELTASVPASDWITVLTLAGRNLKIKGVSRSASDLLTRLEDSPIFEDVKFLSAIVKKKDGLESFHIGLRLDEKKR